jgi:hypothetical protein
MALLPQIQYGNPVEDGVNLYNSGLKLGTQQREQNALRDVGQLLAAGNQKGARNALYTAGMVDQGLKIDDRMRSQAQQAEARALALQEKRQALALKAQGALANVAYLADTPEKFEAGKAMLAKAGMDVSGYDFSQREALLAQAVDAKTRMEADLKSRSPIEVGNALVQKQPDGSFKEMYRAPTKAGDAPSGYRATPDGASLEPIPGGPADPTVKPKGRDKFTEVQSKSGNFANMMVKAEEELASVTGKNPDGTLKPVANPKNLLGALRDGVVPIEAARNAMRADVTQAYEQSAKQWIRAKLRKESGAAIGKEEMQQEFETYFPQYWDGPETIARKTRAREEAVKGMIAESGGSYELLFQEGDGAKGAKKTAPRGDPALKKKYGLE